LFRVEKTYPTNPGNLAKELTRFYPDVFTADFEENRALVKKMIVTQSKSLRNEVAGHITRMKIREASGQPMTVPYVGSDDRARRRRRRSRRR
jgi:small subunit ribosomal protein S17e